MRSAGQCGSRRPFRRRDGRPFAEKDNDSLRLAAIGMTACLFGCKQVSVPQGCSARRHGFAARYGLTLGAGGSCSSGFGEFGADGAVTAGSGSGQVFRSASSFSLSLGAAGTSDAAGRLARNHRRRRRNLLLNPRKLGLRTRLRVCRLILAQPNFPTAAQGPIHGDQSLGDLAVGLRRRELLRHHRLLDRRVTVEIDRAPFGTEARQF